MEWRRRRRRRRVRMILMEGRINQLWKLRLQLGKSSPKVPLTCWPANRRQANSSGKLGSSRMAGISKLLRGRPAISHRLGNPLGRRIIGGLRSTKERIMSLQSW